MAELAAGSVRVVLRRLLPVDAGGILALLVAVALPQSTRASFSGCGTSLMSLWQATQSRAAWGDAFKAAALKPGGTPAWRFPVRGPESWQPAQSSELRWRRLLAAEAGGQQGRNGSEPE